MGIGAGLEWVGLLMSLWEVLLVLLLLVVVLVGLVRQQVHIHLVPSLPLLLQDLAPTLECLIVLDVILAVLHGVRVEPLGEYNVVLELAIGHFVDGDSHGNLHILEGALEYLQILQAVQGQLRNKSQPANIDTTRMYCLEYLAVGNPIG